MPAAGREPCGEVVAAVRADYRRIVAAGKKANPQPEKVAGRRGRPAKGKAPNLLERFGNYEEEVLAFVIHGVPFDSNEAERDLRMMKTRQRSAGASGACGRTGSRRSAA